jgi:hypothetical protein
VNRRQELPVGMSLPAEDQGCHFRRESIDLGKSQQRTPSAAAKTRRWNDSFNKQFAFRRDEHQNTKAAGSEWQTIRRSENPNGQSQLN